MRKRYPGAAFAALLYSRPASSKEATLLYGLSFRQNAHLFHGVSIFFQHYDNFVVSECF